MIAVNPCIRSGALAVMQMPESSRISRDRNHTIRKSDLVIQFELEAAGCDQLDEEQLLETIIEAVEADTAGEVQFAWSSTSEL